MLIKFIRFMQNKRNAKLRKRLEDLKIQEHSVFINSCWDKKFNKCSRDLNKLQKEMRRIQKKIDIAKKD